jgi:serine/threonine protein phosphatase PrpC
LETGYSWDTGLLRELNEDSVLCTSFDLRTHLGTISVGLFAVADGMGGHNAGETASDLAVRTLQTEYTSGLFSRSAAPPLSVLASAFKKANRKVFDSAAETELKGMGTPEEARRHPRRNEITRVLGYSRSITPDTHYVKLYAGDNILLCSDGLCGVLTPAEISQTVINAADPDQACTDLTSQANLAGGPDNISVIVVRPDNLPSWQAMIMAGTSIRRT